jgi:uridine kinase
MPREGGAELEWVRRGCARVVPEVRRVQQRHSRPVVVAVDGGSGAGKSVLARAVGSTLDAAVIPVDDFFAAEIPAGAWETFSVEERLRRVFDWDRLREDVVLPLLASRRAQWHAFDFAAGLRADGTYGMQAEPTEVAPAGVVLLDGAYSAGPQLSDLVDLAVLVDVPLPVRHTRLAAREDADFMVGWHRLWDPVEAYYFTHVRPRESFDLVVEGVNPC